MILEKIKDAVKEALLRQGYEGKAFWVVERPAEMAHGDYSTNAALAAKVDANKLAKNLHIDGVERIEVAGKFINFFLSREAVLKEVEMAATSKGWGKNSLYAGKKIMVEYTDPNPFKEFHIGHLMSNAVGESIARLLEQSGAMVVRANYQGDVGVHVAKAIWGKIQKPELAWGAAYIYGSQEYEKNKEEIDELNKKIYEKNDAGINELYDAGKKESLERFEQIYKTLGTKFDYYFFESATGPVGLEIIKKHPEIFEASEGAIIFRGEKYGLHTRVFVNSLGLPTYEAKDLGLAEIKKKTAPFDLSVTVTANEQTEYFKVVLAALAQIHPEWREQFIHVSHGMMRFAGGKMSSRAGNVITGESLLEDLTAAARGREDVAVGAIKYVVLKSGSGKDIIFDPEKSLSLDGDSGPYLQYARVRALSLIKKAKEVEIVAEEGLSPAAGHRGNASESPSSALLARMLIHFPDVLARAAQEMEPHFVTTYLTKLASAFNSWYASERIIGSDNQTYGILLATAAERTLALGLRVLGIPAPEEM